MSPQSTLVNFLLHPPSRSTSCGEIYINVADFSNADRINHTETLLPFMRNIRATGDAEVIWLTYGDVVMKDGPLCRSFAQTFFTWLSTLSPLEAQSIGPIGIAYDVEHIGSTHILETLTFAQELKQVFVHSHFNGDASQIQIQWTIEGEERPSDTDIIMRHADRALMMLYRNHLTTSPKDPFGVDNLLTRLKDFMFTRQCKRCLDDEYAKANYKAKISIMMEGACKVGNSCGKISFCAFDGNDGWGTGSPVQYLLDTLDGLRSAMLSTKIVTSEQFHRLFATDSLFVIHDFEWWTCYFQDPAIADPALCPGYASYAKSCKDK